MKKYQLMLYGAGIGFINALFGAGGGILAVPILRKSGLTQKEAQATSVSVILPLTAITSVIYYCQGNLMIKESLIYLPFGFIGALIGSFALNKTNNSVLQTAFACFMIWAGIRMISG